MALIDKGKMYTCFGGVHKIAHAGKPLKPPGAAPRKNTLPGTIFCYKTQKGPMHRAPALIKLLFLPPLSLMCMSLPVPALAAGIACAALAALICGISPREQITDLKPAAFYGIFLYALSVFSALLERPQAVGQVWRQVWQALNLAWPSALALFWPKNDFLLAFFRLALVVQLSALIFRSTSSLEIRQALSAIEASIRRGLSRIPFVGRFIPQKPRFAQGLALFASFIPELFRTWTQIDLAWRARGGKPGLKKIKTLVFTLIILSFSKASEKAKAHFARST